MHIQLAGAAHLHLLDIKGKEQGKGYFQALREGRLLASGGKGQLPGAPMQVDAGGRKRALAAAAVASGSVAAVSGQGIGDGSHRGNKRRKSILDCMESAHVGDFELNENRVSLVRCLAPGEDVELDECALSTPNTPYI